MFELILAVGHMFEEARYSAYGFTSIFYRTILYIPCNYAVRMHVQWCVRSEYIVYARDKWSQHFFFSTKTFF